MKTRRTKAAVGLGLFAVMATGGFGVQKGYAQGAKVLEEVVVTARKKQESIQDVPVAVSAVGRNTVEASFMMDSTAIKQFAPNVVFDNISAGAPGGGGMSIRGISFQDVEKSFDPAVLIYVDNVPLGTNTGNVMNMLDVERIEVLRGPQGTLFGKNAVGGVIHIHRIKPVLGEWAGKARVRAGNSEQLNVEGVLNVPLTGNLAVKVNAARIDLDEGYYQNVNKDPFAGADPLTAAQRGDADSPTFFEGNEGDSEEKRLGVHLLWNPFETLTAELQANLSRMDGTVPPMLGISDEKAVFCDEFNICQVDENTPFSGDRRKGAGGLEQNFDLDTDFYIGQVNWEMLDSLTAVMILSRHEIDDGQDIDFDGSPRRVFHTLRSSDYVQDSGELRFDYDGGGSLTFTGGLFYWNADLKDWVNDIELPLLLRRAGIPLDEDDCGPSAGQPSCLLQTGEAGSISRSVFFEGDYRITPRWIVTAGARWIEETKSMTRRDTLPVLQGDPIFDSFSEPLPTTRASRTDDDIIHRLGIRYESLGDFMAYLTHSTGFRSGGFSIRSATPETLKQGYDPERLENLEAGVKTTVWDGRVRLNATVFDMKYEDMQQELNIPGGPSGQQDVVVNASEATLRGAELEVNAALTDSVRIDFNAGYLDAEYDDFFGSIFADGVERDLSFLPLRRAPELNYSLALNYTRSLLGGELAGRASYTWTDDYAATATDFPGTHISSYGMADVSVSYSLGGWKLAAFGRNLTDEDEYNHTFVVAPGIDGSSLWSFATPRAPTTYGMELMYTFGNY